MLRNEISTDELLNLLYAEGYKIEVIKELETDTEYHYLAKFIGRFSAYPYIAGMYGSEFSSEEIRKDCALKLLKWTGKKVVYAIE